MSLSLSIGGVEWQNRIGTVRLNIELNRTRTLNLELIGTANVDGDAVVVGVPVLLHDVALGVTYFSGSVSSIVGEESPRRDRTIRRLGCVDHNAVCARRIFTGSWTNVHAGNIIGEICDAILADEGITHTAVASGPILPSFSVSAAYLNDIFDQICAACLKVSSPVTEAATQYAWTIAYDKNFHFFSVIDGISAAAFSFSDTASVHQMDPPPILTEDLANYANRITIRVSNVLGAGTTVSDYVSGGGGVTTWTTSAIVGSAAVVLLNGVNKTVGVLHVDTGKDFYYTIGTSLITQDASGTVLSNTDHLTIEYTPDRKSVV